MLSFLLNIILFVWFPNSIEEKLQNAVMKALPGYDKYEVKLISQKSSANILIDDERELKRNGNLVYVPVKSTDRKSRINENYLTCEVKLYKEILTAKNNIPKWKVLDNDVLEFVLTDISKGDSFLDSFEDTENMRAVTFIKKGEKLKKNLIEESPVMKAGERIVAHSVSGNVDIQLDAITQQDGWINNLVRVKTKDNKLFKAKVVDNKNVLIVE